MTSITTRAGKGSPLTHNEVDANFTNLNTDKLDTAGIALGSAASPTIKFTGDTNTGIYSPGADELAVSTAGTERLRIDSSGNVGIGTSSPTFNLVSANNTTDGGWLYSSGTVSTLGLGGYSLAGDGAVQLKYDRSTGAITFNGGSRDTPVERARIDGSGRLLVGTSTNSNFIGTGFSSLFQVQESSGILGLGIERPTNDTSGPSINLRKTRATSAGGVTIVQNGDNLAEFRFLGTDGTGSIQAAGITAAVDGTPGTNDMPGRLAFSTTADGASSPTERLRIDSSGNVGIGTSSVQARFQVETNITNTTGQRVALFRGTGAGDAAYEAVGCIKFDNNTTTSQVFHRFYINGGILGSGQINANGVGAAAFGGYSDIRLKENIANISPQLQNICSLRPVEFDYKDGSGHQIGFIAQEIEEIYPDVVATGLDDMLTVTGWSKTEARLVKAFQEAIARIETLEAEVAALKGA